MVYRRVIQLSPTTKVVSLPSSWLSKYKIKKGDYVNIEESGNKIIIETTKSNSDITRCDVSELNEDLLWTAIDAFYMLGHSHIELKVKSDQTKLLHTIVKFFPMYVIISESKTIVELKAISNNLEMDFDKTIQHIRYMTSTIVDEGLNLISKKDWASLPKVKNIDYTLNTYISMCFRHLNSGKIDDAVTWAQYAKIIESYADRLCMLFEEISKNKSITSKDIECIKKINDLYNDSFKLSNKFSLKKANEHYDMRKSLESSIVNSKLYYVFNDLIRSIYDLQEIIFQLNHKAI